MTSPHLATRTSLWLATFRITSEYEAKAKAIYLAAHMLAPLMQVGLQRTPCLRAACQLELLGLRRLQQPTHAAHHFIGHGIGYNMFLAVRPPIPRNPFTGSETEDLCTKCGLIVTGYKAGHGLPTARSERKK